MRFMVIVKASKDSEAGKMPSQELLAAMGKYNEELVKAGIMLSGEGLQPSSKGARVRFSGSKRIVTNFETRVCSADELPFGDAQPANFARPRALIDKPPKRKDGPTSWR